MTLQQGKTRHRHRQRESALHTVANSKDWQDLARPVLEAWLNRYERERGGKHRPAADKVANVTQYLCSRQRHRKDMGWPNDRIVQETAEQVAGGCKISKGTVNDVLRFLEWLGVLPTLKAGGKGCPTVRQLLRPQDSLLWDSPTTKEALGYGIGGDSHGITRSKLRDNPAAPGYLVTKEGHRPPADAVAAAFDRDESARALKQQREKWAK
jgi:hypothetical protein